MKRGKKYVEAAKVIDRTVQYDITEAIGLAKKVAIAKFDEEPAVMDVMQNSRSVAQ